MTGGSGSVPLTFRSDPGSQKTYGSGSGTMVGKIVIVET
jgi:hypothetical protein